MDTRRIKWDNIKFVLICFVVIGHIGDEYIRMSPFLRSFQFWIYTFHMPAFVFVSGLFSKGIVKGRRWDKIARYLVLYLFMKVFYYIVRAIVLEGVSEISFDLFSEEGIPWYALAMCWFYTLTILTANVKKTYVLSVSLFLACFSGYISDISSFLALRRVIVFFPAFYLGYICNPDSLEAFLKKPAVLAACWMILILSMIAAFRGSESLSGWRDLFRGKYMYAALDVNIRPEWGFVYGFAGMMISGMMSLSIFAAVPSGKSYLSTIGSRTLSIYAIHGTLLSFLSREDEQIRGWLTCGHTGMKAAAFCLGLVFLLSIRPVYYLVLRMTGIPLENGRRS